MYDLGYQNNNCKGCVKGGMWYWNKIRKDFPDVFEIRARQEREIGKTCITEKVDGQTMQVYLDELDPDRGRPEDEIMGECSLMCHYHMKDHGLNADGVAGAETIAKMMEVLK
jgi:hypothetical protein